MPNPDRYTFHAMSSLDLLERRWAHRLRRVSLVTELDADEVMVKAAADGLGKIYRGLGSERHRELSERWPGCVAVAVAGIAATGYRSGAFWPQWWAAAHYPGRARDNTAFGEAFLAALRTLGLPDFPQQARKQKYLGPIAMHAGIPTSCLEGFLRFLLNRHARDLSPDQPSDPSLDRFGGLDEPVRQFLLHGGDYAGDLADRCLDLLERLRGPEPDLDGLGLPARIVEHARSLVREGLLDLTRDRSGARPRLALAPFGQGIHLTLPATHEHWTVETGDVTAEVRGHAMAGEATFTIARPARTLRVTPHGSTDPAEETVLDLVDPADPLLVFTEDGRRFPAHQALPPDTVWAAHPGDRPLTADTPLRVVAESLLPVGWPGWRLIQISLADATWLAAGEGPRHPVRGQNGKNKPRVLTEEPITGITTPGGSAVVAALPHVHLPGGGLTWSLTVRPTGGGATVFTGSFTTAEPTEITELWDRVPRPVRGTFTITVRGPIGKGTRRTIVVAEGLAARSEPQIRLCDDGLLPATAHITAPGLTQTLTFSPTETELPFTWDTESYIFTPPHMRVAADGHEWNAGPLRLPVEALGDTESLRIDIPGLQTPPPLEVQADGHAVQELAPSARGHYSLRRILDTVTAHHGADLTLTLEGKRVPVAIIRPAGHASGIEHHGDHLTLTDLVWAEGLTAGIYLAEQDARHDPDSAAAAAPPGPALVPVAPDGTIPLPPHLTAARRLRVRLAVRDPWLPPDWPTSPPPQTLACESPYAARSGSSATCGTG